MKPKDGTLSIHTDKPKRRTPLTLTDRVAKIDKAIARHTQRLAQLNARRQDMIDLERAILASAQTAIDNAVKSPAEQSR